MKITIILSAFLVFASACSVQPNLPNQVQQADTQSSRSEFSLQKAIPKPVVIKAPVAAKQVTIHFSTGMFVELLIKIQQLLVEKCYLAWNNNFFTLEEAKEVTAVATFQKRVAKLATPTLSFTVSAYTQNDNSEESARTMLAVLTSNPNDVVVLSVKAYNAIKDKDASKWETKINDDFISVWNKDAFSATDLPIVFKAQQALFARSGFDLATLSLGLSMVRTQLKDAASKVSICKPPVLIPVIVDPKSGIE